MLRDQRPHARLIASVPIKSAALGAIAQSTPVVRLSRTTTRALSRIVKRKNHVAADIVCAAVTKTVMLCAR
jgi:hypothetical protein